MSALNLPSVSVVVPTHNRRAQLPALLDALASEPAEELVVVVNASRDGSLELLEERAEQDPRLKPLFVEEPGEGIARQEGVERAGGEVVLMLDDDVIPKPGLVRGHARHHAEGTGLVVLGYMPVADPGRRRPGEYPIDLYSRAYEQACAGYETDPSSILRGLWAGNVSLRRADFLRAAEAPAGYEYHEDRNFGLRCAAAGLEGVFDRELLASHHFAKSPQGFLAAARRSGEVRAAIHAEHGKTIGALSPDFFEQGMPQPGRALVRLARRRRLYRPVQRLLATMTRLAGALRLFRVESHIGYVMGTIEQQRAALAVGGPRR